MRHQWSTPVKSWPLAIDPFVERRVTNDPPTASPDAPKAHFSAPGTAVWVEQEGPGHSTPAVRNVRTTGLIQVPGGQGNIIQLFAYISSFSHQKEEACLLLYEREGDKLTLLSEEQMVVQPGGVGHVVFDGVDRKTAQLDVSLSSKRLVPSVAVTETFLADGARIVLMYRSPADFIAL